MESIDNEVELSDEMLTADCNWDDYHPMVDISRVTVKSSCVCEVDVLDQHNEVEAKVRNIVNPINCRNVSDSSKQAKFLSLTISGRHH